MKFPWSLNQEHPERSNSAIWNGVPGVPAKPCRFGSLNPQTHHSQSTSSVDTAPAYEDRNERVLKEFYVQSKQTMPSSNLRLRDIPGFGTVAAPCSQKSLQLLLESMSPKGGRKKN